MKKYLLLLLLLLVSCDDSSFPRCVDADDFLGHGLTISACVPEGSNKFIADDGSSSDGFNAEQVTRWKDTGYVTTGAQLIVRTEGMWTAWQGMMNSIISTSSSCGNDNFDTQNKYEDQINASAVPQNRICGPYPTKDPLIQGCNQARQCPYVELGDPPDNVGQDEYGPPCWFTNGYGAYLLIKKPSDPEPNSTLDLMRYPQSSIIHIGYDINTGEYSSLEHPIIDNNCNIITLERGWKIYAKILDRFYWNDSGGYGIQFISGARKADERQFLEDLRVAVSDILMTGAENIFRNITTNNDYINFVKALLALYIAFTGLVYVFGMVQQPYADMIVRILKIALIMQFISPYSWEFFYNNLAILFVEGTAQLIAMINSHSGVPFDPDRPFVVFDNMLDIFFSTVTWRQKMVAFIWTYPPVLVLLILFLILIILLSYVVVMIYACIMYLTSLIGIAILISLMPILFLAMLFSKIPNTFENWLKQAMSFAFQSIMIFTLVSLFGALVMNFYYRTFGFTTCYNKTVEFSLCLFENSTCFTIEEIWSWTFGDKFDYYTVGPWPPDLGQKKRSTFTRGAAVIKLPPDYKYDDYRYIDYPFYDPDPDSTSPIPQGEEGKGYDWDIIKNKFQNGTKDEFVVYQELFALVLLTMLLFHLRLIVQRMGASIAGASPFLTVIGNHYENFFQPNSVSIAGWPGGKINEWMRKAKQSYYTKLIGAYDLPEKAVRALPGGDSLLDSKIAGVAKGAFNVAKWSVGAESGIKANLRERDERDERDAFKWIHHKQAVIGQTLSDLSPDHLVKSTLSYGYNSVLGRTGEEIGGQSYSQQLEKLHDNILGYKRPGPEKYKEEVDDGINPFQRSAPLTEEFDDTHRSSDVSEHTMTDPDITESDEGDKSITDSLSSNLAPDSEDGPPRYQERLEEVQERQSIESGDEEIRGSDTDQLKDPEEELTNRSSISSDNIENPGSISEHTITDPDITESDEGDKSITDSLSSSNLAPDSEDGPPDVYKEQLREAEKKQQDENQNSPDETPKKKKKKRKEGDWSSGYDPDEED